MLARRRPLANKQVCPEHREDGLWLKFSFYQRGGLLLKGPSLGCESHYSLQGGHEQFYRVMRQQNYSRVQCPYHVITRWACLLEASILCILSPRAISISLACPSMNPLCKFSSYLAHHSKTASTKRLLLNGRELLGILPPPLICLRA